MDNKHDDKYSDNKFHLDEIDEFFYKNFNVLLDYDNNKTKSQNNNILKSDDNLVDILEIEDDALIDVLELDDEKDTIDILDIDDENIDTLELDNESNIDILEIEDTTPIDVLEIDDAYNTVVPNNIQDNNLEFTNDNVKLESKPSNQNNNLTIDDDSKKIKKYILFIPLIIIIICLFFVIYKIVRWKLDNNSINSQIKNIQSEVTIEEVTDNENTIIVNPIQENSEEEEVQLPDNDYYNFINVPLMSVDINNLKSKNKDTVGWLKVNGTNINYPVVQSLDNDYYLRHSFDNKYNDAGWIFVDYKNNMIDDKNMIIYGHSRLNSTMFGTLKNVVKPNWYSNSENYLVKLSMENANTSWQVFSTYITEAEEYYIRISFSDNVDYLNFLNVIKNRSIHNYGVPINENDRILTLSTCYTDNKRVVLHAKLIKMENR